MLAKGPWRFVAAALLNSAALLGTLLLAACDDSSRARPPEVDQASMLPAEFVGGEVCAACHQDEAAAWQGSQHDLAMQPATATTVLGNFADAEFVAGEVTTRFFQRDGGYFVYTDGPDGEPADFEIVWTFGVEPLQQYLVELDSGRVQALSIAWDSRSAAEGGQRWFHLYAEDAIDSGDPLHWTGTYQRWNTMCADCHSTNLVKNYDVATDSFATTSSSSDVDCEACHGPGSLHSMDPTIAPPALPSRQHGWVFAPGESIASREPAEASTAEAEVCAACHSRRAQLTDDHDPGDPLLAGFRPALLEPGLYHADGQIEAEVYVYGSFLQSAMARQGVTCSDCHEPHSARLRADGNGLCAQCHLPSTYDQPAHHRHESGTRSAECVSCHMRSETYMVVDPRRDHSFRVPRPDLSATLNSPNACNDCHGDQTNAWAAARVAEWFPGGQWNEAHFGQALQAGRSWAADARVELTALVRDSEAPEIARATGLSLLGSQFGFADAELLERSLDRDEPLLQLAAIEAAAALAAEQQVDLVQRFLTDERLALRIAAARVLLSARGLLSVRRQADLAAALAEYLAVQVFNGDRPEGLLSSAGVAVEQGLYAEAEELFREAILRHPAFPALYVNLADLYRITGRGGEAEQVLRTGLAANPDAAAIELALAFALVRNGAAEEALGHFSAAAELAPDDPYYQYVLAIAHNDAGDTPGAIELLQSAHERFPGYGDILFALATLLRDGGQIEAAHGYAERLVATLPGDQNALSLLRELEQRL